MAKSSAKPEILYHFTNLVGLSAILSTRHISLTESNLNIRDGNCGVVWLTSSPDSKNHGLKFDNTIPVELDKTIIRIALLNKPSFKQWDGWSDSKGMDGDYKSSLIASAKAEETYMTWYISETEIPVGDFIKVENTMTSEVISVENSLKSMPEVKTLKANFLNVIDGYIASQSMHLQVLLLNVREAIQRALPDATEKISWEMPTFWKGRNIIHFAAQKNHLGIYPGAEAMKHFAPRLTEYKTSKGAIQFPYKSFGEEQLKLIAEIAEWCGKKWKIRNRK